jgi:hypothetical protein
MKAYYREIDEWAEFDMTTQWRSEPMRRVYVVAVYLWLAVALLFAMFASRLSAVVIVPVAVMLWYAAHAWRLTQSAQLVWPVLLLPGAVLSFIGFMQSMHYGRMDNEPDVQFATARLIFFVVGIALHAGAFWFVATESRAIDHPSGARAHRL